jgi:hypothetical protein
MEEFRIKYLDWYKWIYEGELKRKDEIDKLLAFPVTVLSVFAGTAYFIIKQYTDNWDRTLTVSSTVFFLLCATFGFFFLRTGYFLIQVFYRDTREYHYLDTLDNWNKYITDDLIANNPVPETQERDKHLGQLQKHFELQLIEKYSEFSSHNSRINDDRTQSYYRARKHIVRSYVIFVVLSVFGLLNAFIMPKKETPSNQPVIYNIYPMSSNKPEQSQPKPQASPKPITSTPPPARRLKEDIDRGGQTKIDRSTPNKK